MDEPAQSGVTADSIQSLTLEKLAGHYPWVHAITRMAMWLLIIGIVLALFNQPFVVIPAEIAMLQTGVVSIIAIWAVLRSLYGFVADRAMGYSYTAQNIHFFRGVLLRTLISQPITRIQHIELTQGPIERLSNLASLHIYSAGSAMQSFSIPGLAAADAHQLRQQLLADVNTDIQDGVIDD